MSLNESHRVLHSASCSHELGSPASSLVQNCRISCAQCACGHPLPVGLMCTVAAVWLTVPCFLAASPAHFQWRRREVTCHLSICCLCVVLATFLAESVCHWTHAAMSFSSSPVAFVLFVRHRHHLEKALSVPIILASNAGVSFHVSAPYNRLGLTGVCRSLILAPCDIVVLLKRIASAWAVSHACLSLC